MYIQVIICPIIIFFCTFVCLSELHDCLLSLPIIASCKFFATSPGFPYFTLHFLFFVPLCALTVFLFRRLYFLWAASSKQIWE